MKIVLNISYTSCSPPFLHLYPCVHLQVKMDTHDTHALLSNLFFLLSVHFYTSFFFFPIWVHTVFIATEFVDIPQMIGRWLIWFGDNINCTYKCTHRMQFQSKAHRIPTEASPDWLKHVVDSRATMTLLCLLDSGTIGSFDRGTVISLYVAIIA